MTRRSPVTPVSIGVALTILFLLALGYLAQRRAQVDQDVPSLTLLAPAATASTDSPLVIRFTSGRPLALKPTGWGTGRLHVHALINDVEHMPGAADVRAVDSLTFEWTMRAVGRGLVRIQLGWADAGHRNIAAGRTPEVATELR